MLITGRELALPANWAKRLLEIEMYCFPSRYLALKAFPNAIVRKILNHHVNSNAGDYVVFNDYSTYED